MVTKFIVAVITPEPGHADTVEQALEVVVPAVRREPGCIQYDLHRDQSKLGRFVMIEQWSDAKALKVHSDGAVTTGLLSGSFPVSLMAVRRLRWSIWPGLFDVSATVGEPAFRRVGSTEVVGIGIRSNF